MLAELCGKLSHGFIRKVLWMKIECVINHSLNPVRKKLGSTKKDTSNLTELSGPGKLYSWPRGCAWKSKQDSKSTNSNSGGGCVMCRSKERTMTTHA